MKALTAGIFAFAVACGSDDSLSGIPKVDPTTIPGITPPPNEVPPSTSFTELQATALAMASTVACAITSIESSVVCWGLFPTVVQQNALGRNAVRIDLGGPAVQVAVGGRMACARLKDQTLRCWGDRGAHGVETEQPDTTKAVKPEGLDTTEDVSVGDDHICAVSKGRVLCWGKNSDGQLGDGTMITRRVPAEVQGIADAKAVSVGPDFSCALLQQGNIKCWGSNRNGQLGVAPAQRGAPRVTPVEVPGLTSVMALSASESTTCVLQGGKTLCWGAHSWSSGTNENTNPPIVTVAGIEGATSLSTSASSDQGCALTPTGALCFEQPTQKKSAALLAGSQGASRVAIAESTSLETYCAIFGDARVKCWGSNDKMLLGDGSFVTHPQPVYVEGVENASFLSVGPSRNCVIGTDGAVKCWGDSAVRKDDGRPVAIAELAASTWVGTTPLRTCGIKAGILRCVQNDVAAPRPILETAGISNVEEMASVDRQGEESCARLATGELACWRGAAPAVPLPGVSGVKKLQTEGKQFLLLQPNGVNSLLAPSTASQQITSLGKEFLGAADLACGGSTICARRTNDIYCSTNGLAMFDPIPIAPTDTVQSLAAGIGYACALWGGTAKCWGYGTSGELGTSIFGSSKTPVAISLSEPARAMGTARFHSCALLASGRVECWGRNESASISPKVEDTNAPTQVRLRW
jgi:hypothetical protein